jgi:hypothetical protein
MHEEKIVNLFSEEFQKSSIFPKRTLVIAISGDRRKLIEISPSNSVVLPYFIPEGEPHHDP